MTTMIGKEVARVRAGPRTLVLTAEPPRMGIPARANLYFEGIDNRGEEFRKFGVSMSAARVSALIDGLQRALEELNASRHDGAGKEGTT